MDTASLEGMMEATRLTRAGRLTEATAFLQRLLQGEPAPAASAPSGYDGITIEGSAETIEDDGGTAERVSAFRREAPGRAHDKAAASGGGRFIALQLGGEAGSRPCKLYIPSGYTGQPVPLIVMLHGCTQSPDDFAAGTRMNEAAEARTCLVAYPGQTAAANPSKCWNWFKAGDQQRGKGEPAVIAGMTAEIMRRYAVDPAHVHVAGLSAGGAAAAVMGATYPDLYAAIGVHSGLACGAASDMPSAFAAMAQGTAGGPGRRKAGADAGRRAVPAIVFHGDRDKTVHPRNAEEVIAQAAAAQPLERRTEAGRVPGGHAWRRTIHVDSQGETALEQWVIEGAGHAWSGGSAAGTYTDPRGPDATKEMLRFFLAHPRR